VSSVVAFASFQDDHQGGLDQHLRAVLERVPIALVRVDVNGTLLAVNEAALGLLGAQALHEVLGTSLHSFLPDESRAACKTLLENVSQGQGGSLEVDLTELTGVTHALELRAVAYPGASDAIPSALMTARDVTRSRNLARSLEEAVARQADSNAAHAAQLAGIERAHAASVDEMHAAHRTALAALESAHEAQRAEADTAHNARVAELDAAHAQRLSAAETDRQRLVAAIARLARDAGLQTTGEE
jgi:PAS domain S-box-containing protein